MSGPLCVELGRTVLFSPCVYGKADVKGSCSGRGAGGAPLGARSPNPLSQAGTVCIAYAVPPDFFSFLGGSSKPGERAPWGALPAPGLQGALQGETQVCALTALR